MSFFSGHTPKRDSGEERGDWGGGGGGGVRGRKRGGGKETHVNNLRPSISQFISPLKRELISLQSLLNFKAIHLSFLNTLGGSQTLDFKWQRKEPVLI